MKQKLIKFLGGCPKNEVVETCKELITATRLATLAMVEGKMKSIDGLSGDEWAKQMWDFIEKHIEACPEFELGVEDGHLTITMTEEVEPYNQEEE